VKAIRALVQLDKDAQTLHLAVDMGPVAAVKVLVQRRCAMGTRGNYLRRRVVRGDAQWPCRRRRRRPRRLCNVRKGSR
jgi:hypothetical protein